MACATVFISDKYRYKQIRTNAKLFWLKTKQKSLLYLFGIGGFGRLVSGRLSQSGAQRRLGWTLGTTGHGGRFACAVTQLVEAALQPAVTTSAVLWSIYNSEHQRLPSIGLVRGNRNIITQLSKWTHNMLPQSCSAYSPKNQNTRCICEVRVLGIF